MNRDKDFHKKEDGVVVNTNTGDFKRARNRNRVMREHKEAFSEDGVIDGFKKRLKNFEDAIPNKKVIDLEKQVKDLVDENNRPDHKAERIDTDIRNLRDDVVNIKDSISEIRDMLQSLTEGGNS